MPREYGTLLFLQVLNEGFFHSFVLKGAGFPILYSPFSRWPIPICLVFACGVFRVEEKPAPFTKSVKSAAPENRTYPKPNPPATTLRFLLGIAYENFVDYSRTPN